MDSPSLGLSAPYAYQEHHLIPKIQNPNSHRLRKRESEEHTQRQIQEEE